MSQMWADTEEDLLELSQSESFKRLEVEARIARLQETVDNILARMCRTSLLNADSDRHLLRFQANVVALLQLQNALNGKIGGALSNGGKNV